MLLRSSTYHKGFVVNAAENTVGENVGFGVYSNEVTLIMKYLRNFYD